MIDSTWGRSLATTTAPAGPVGDESIPQAARPPGLIPSEPPRAGCPINPRPRILEQYQAASDAAEGAPVRELDACQVGEGMRIWHMHRFATVTDAAQKRVSDIAGALTTGEEARQHPFVVLRLRAADVTGWLIAELTAPVYCLASAPDAIHAPGAEATAVESTAVAR